MNVAINGCIWWSLVSFEKAIEGPSIRFFDAKSYGAGLKSLLVRIDDPK